MLCVGDLVVYKGRKDEMLKRLNVSTHQLPLAVVVETTNKDNNYHSRVRVMWVGKTNKAVANSMSINGSNVTTWVHPENFILVKDLKNIQNQQKENVCLERQ